MIAVRVCQSLTRLNSAARAVCVGSLGAAFVKSGLRETENLPISAILPGHYTVVSDCLRHDGPSRYFLL